MSEPTHHERFGCDVCFGFDPPRNPYWRDNITKTCDPCEARIQDRLVALTEARAAPPAAPLDVDALAEALVWESDPQPEDSLSLWSMMGEATKEHYRERARRLRARLSDSKEPPAGKEGE